MHEFVSINGRMASPSDAVISAASAAALYGKGIFTTVAVFGGRPFLWEKHWQRLENDAAKFGIDLAEVSEQSILGSLGELIEANSLINGRARITLFDESAGGIWPFESEQKTSVLITTAEFRDRPASFKLTVSPYRMNSTSPLAGIKSCNYLENLLCLKEARTRGFHEAIRLNERGEVVSVCMANIFWERDDRLFTTSLKTGCLRGTTRDFVLGDLPCSEVERGIEELRFAERIFLTSAGIGIVQVENLDGREFAKRAHPILELFPEVH